MRPDTTEPDPETGLIYGVQDLTMRLGESLIRYRGKPAYVRGNDGRNLYLLLTRSQEETVIRLPDESIDVRPVPLGYVNGNSKCWFVTRSPERRYKQGLTARTINISGPRMSMPVSSFITCLGFAKCILNEYPDYANALKSVLRSNGSKAFSRRFALQYDKDLKEVALLHRGKRVGMLDGNKPVLSSANKYLQEELESAV
jgi:hypothetical protein